MYSSRDPYPTNQSDLQESTRFSAGASVHVIGGSYNGKNGVVVKQTAARVRIRLDFPDSKEVCLAPKHVRVRASNLQHNQIHTLAASPRCASTDLNSIDYQSAILQPPQKAQPTDDSSWQRDSGLNSNRASLHRDGSHNHDTSRSANPQQSSTFTAGTPVNVTGGTYKGNSGIVLKQTAARVRIKLDFPDLREVCLMPTNVSQKVFYKDNIAHHRSPVGTTRPNVVVSSTPEKGAPSMTGSIASVRPAEGTPDKPFRSTQTETATFNPGMPVEVIGGTYAGKSGIIVKQTAARVRILLDHPDSKEVCLAPKNVCLKGSYSDHASLNGRAPDKATMHRTVRMETWEGSAPSDASPTLYQSGESLGFEEEYLRLVPPGKANRLAPTYAFQLFGNRLRTFKVEFGKGCNQLPAQKSDRLGYTHELLCVKSTKEKHLFGLKTGFTALYVTTSGPQIETISVKETLLKLAAFDQIPARKVAARLELLMSPALKSTAPATTKCDHLIFQLRSNEIELISEAAHEGCGFIPPSLIHRFLGHHQKGQRTFGIQVRLFAPDYGVFKGLLFAKHGINKIQLPSSMKKVGPSDFPDGSAASIIVIGAFPSATNVNLAELWSGTARATFQALNDMVTRVLHEKGVPFDKLQSEYLDLLNRRPSIPVQHASIVGVADPTEAIPPGQVFLTGFQEMPRIKDKVFVTRYPCTHANDGLVLEVLTQIPDAMPQSTWDWLCTLHFGAIVFGNPPLDGIPTPLHIADGDLDGDLYFICWNESILSYMETSTYADLARSGEISLSTDEEALAQNLDWLRDAQDVMGNMQAAVDLDEVIRVCYKHWKDGTSTEAEDFGTAYKEALKLGKHGGCIYLPACRMEKVANRLHQYFTNIKKESWALI